MILNILQKPGVLDKNPGLFCIAKTDRLFGSVQQSVRSRKIILPAPAGRRGGGLQPKNQAADFDVEKPC